MFAAIYARHSSDRQNNSSSQDQIERCQQWAHERNYTVTEIYADEAISGSSFLLRPAIQKLIGEAADGLFDIIVCEDLSRLSRDLKDIAHFFERMHYLRVKIITLNEGEIGLLQVGLKGTMNALYLKDLADKTLRGNVASVLKGRVPGGKKIFGYDQAYTKAENLPITGHRVINDKEADIVRRIFDYFLEGRPLPWIAKYLNETGVTAPAGGIWRTNTLAGTKARQAGLLRQTLYSGLITFNKQSYQVNPETGKRVSRINPSEKWVKVPIPHLRILEEGVFKAADQEFKNREHGFSNDHMLSITKMIKDQDPRFKKARLKKISTRKTESDVLTRAKLYCGKCSNKFHAIDGVRICCRTENCDNKSFKRQDIRDLILRQMKSFSKSDLRNLSTSTSQDLEECISRREKALKKRKDLRIKIENIINSLNNIKVGQETESIINSFEYEIKKLNGKIDKLNHEIKLKTPLSDAEIIHIHQKFKTLLFEYHKSPKNHLILHRLNKMIERVSVIRQGSEIKIRLKYNWPNFYNDLTKN